MKKIILSLGFLFCHAAYFLHAQHTYTGPYIEDGLYYLKPVGSERFLDISGSCENQNGCTVQLYGLGKSDKNNKFYIRKTSDAGTYVITCFSSNKVLEARMETITEDGGKVQIWDEVPGIGGRLGRGNQEWFAYIFNGTTGGNWRFEPTSKGVATNMGVLRSGLNKNKTAVLLYRNTNQEAVIDWQLIKVHQEPGSSMNSAGNKKKRKVLKE